MTCSKNILSKFLLLTFILFSLIFSVSAISYNEGGDFTLDVPNLKQTTLSTDIKANFLMTIENNLDYSQEFKITVPEISGWEIVFSQETFSIPANSQEVIEISFVANSNFNYEQSVVSPSEVVISQKKDYVGNFDFPVVVIGESETISVKYILEIRPEVKEEVKYQIDISTNSISPENPFGFSVKGENIDGIQDVNIITKIANEEFLISDKFDSRNNFKIYQEEIPTSIDPGVYNVKVTLRVVSQSADNRIIEWSEDKDIVVDLYENVIVEESSKKSIIKDTYFINIKNNGNTRTVFQKDVDINWFNSLVFSSNQNDEYYVDSQNGVMFNVPLEKGESTTIEIVFNYLIIYVVLVVIIIISTYIFIRKNSNPLDIETKIYEIKKVTHEGIKSMKIRIGFENIKEVEIEKLTLKFMMPSYLKVKDNSFLLTEPNRILKGTNEYKLVWEFKRFEKNDSRILGFSLINSRGILGDIKIPNLEIEVHSKGKIRKYYKSFPIIKG